MAGVVKHVLAIICLFRKSNKEIDINIIAINIYEGFFIESMLSVDSSLGD